MRQTCLLVSFVFLLAGCAGSATDNGAPTSSSATENDDEQPTWEARGNVTLGWLVGVGADNFLGDFDTGLTTHDVCPRATFYLPSPVSTVHIGWRDPAVDTERPGVGQYTLVVVSPTSISFITTAVEEGGRDVEKPIGGIWELKVQSTPAAVNLLWEIEVTATGFGPQPELIFYHDGDCIQ